MTGAGAHAAACRLLFRQAAGLEAGSESDARQVLTHQDIDWIWLATYLTGSGLARPLLGVLTTPAIAQHTPASFQSTLMQCGMVDVVRERALRAAIARIDAALHARGAHGVLLKGTALLMRTPTGTPPRATGDVDVYVAAPAAGQLREDLLDAGFTGDRHAGRSTSHHLAPVACDGVDVEIHTRLMKAHWGLPEDEMLARATPIPGTRALLTLDGEGLVLHSLVHLTASFQSYGLKSAWDIAAVLRATPAFDWHRLVQWGGGSALPRAFWGPFVALAEGVPLEVPAALLARAPRDRGACRMAALARSRVFGATEGLFDLDALSKAGFVLLLHETWAGRLAFLRKAVGFRAARPDTWSATAGRARRSHLLRQAWRNYRTFRRLTGDA